MIKITETAREKMIEVLTEEDAKMLRFGLQGGGCNGFQYFFSIEESGVKEEDDHAIEISEDYILLIDAMSMMYLTESEVDYKRDLMGESFVFNNPNTVHTCGCGSSVGF